MNTVISQQQREALRAHFKGKKCVFASYGCTLFKIHVRLSDVSIICCFGQVLADGPSPKEDQGNPPPLDSESEVCKDIEAAKEGYVLPSPQVRTL